MPRSLAPIPSGTPIVDPPSGAVTIFFRLLWQTLINGFLYTPDVAVISQTNQSAAIVTSNAYVTLNAGWYRISFYLRKTIPDGVSSSLQMTLGWTDHGQPLTDTFVALTVDTDTAFQTGSVLVFADADTALSYAVAYASNTPGAMTFNVDVTVEQMS